MRKMVTFFYIDALNSSFLNPSIMPFLSDLAAKHYKELENVAGYSFAIQSCMLSGKYPDQTNHWMPYFYDSQGTSLLFKTLKKVGSFSALDKLPVFRYLLTGQTRRFLLKKGVHANNIPLHIIDKIAIYPYYYMCELPFFRELRELLEKKCQASLTYIGPPEIKSSIYDPLLKYIRASTDEVEFVIAYDDRLDMLGHRFGPHSSECLRYAKSLDSVLLTTYQTLKKRFQKNLTFVIFSDHGQCEKAFEFNVLSELANNGLNLDEDYFCFVDATLALFWPENEVAKEKILETLLRNESGRVINEDLREKCHIRFKDKRYGEIIFMLKPGGTFSPNFFSPFGPMKGLHGYLPEEKVQKGFLVSNENFSHRFSHVKDFQDFSLNISSSYI